jgi:peptide/nickel transport system permease protein
MSGLLLPAVGLDPVKLAAVPAEQPAGGAAPRGRPSQSPWAVFWREFKKSPVALVGGGILAVFYLGVLFAPFVAPYPMAFQNRQLSWAPPTRVHLIDSAGRLHWRPFVYGHAVESVAAKRYGEEKEVIYPIRFFHRGEPYQFLGLTFHRHLFGVDDPGRIFLFGADLYGRDVFSRIVYGGRISLSVGLVGIAISFSLGLLLGGIAGYLGGPTDTILMRMTEILMSIPGLYMILALRSVFPDDMPSDRMYLIIVGILSLIAWASISRVIRGMVLSIRENEFVTAARALGMGNLRIIIRHILPQLSRCRDTGAAGELGTHAVAGSECERAAELRLGTGPRVLHLHHGPRLQLPRRRAPGCPRSAQGSLTGWAGFSGLAGSRGRARWLRKRIRDRP